MKHVKNILIVEDRMLVALDIEKQLMSCGYASINSVSNFPQAVSKINETNPDLILLDIILKDGPTGFKIAQIANERNIPIVFVTASTHGDYFRRAKAYRPEAILHKPLDEKKLKETVQSIMH